MLTRRAFLAGSALAAGSFRQSAQEIPQPTSSAVLHQAESLVQAFMKAYAVPALSLAYGRGAKLLLAQAYGVADSKARRPATSQSLFRIASVSKPITSAAIFSLVEAGKLQVSDRVFGPGGLLSGIPVTSPSVQQITVHELLTHTAGGWSNQQRDPMFHSHDRDPGAFLQHTLQEYPLSDMPGTAFAYSNFGYFLLGRVIEHASGQAYATYVQQHVLHPLGITDMKLASREPAPGEVRYYGQGHISPYELPIALHDANGGWLATPSDLVRFALGVFSRQDDAGAPALLKVGTLQQMTKPTVINPHYACGWAASPDGDFTHTGSLPGTMSLVMHRHDGLAWALLANTQRPHSAMEEDFRQLSWSLARLLATT